ncbi:hypothetical protein LIN78_01955 [Leeia sp. TBRC 13508]|uniref:DUF2190 domain-containing protein n=1 Tax=Leeia speluncae TaxID=2884804 RepID=A0ABS8D297_9NEIS|nr:hypothetical protein [Leeia speluncae]MCB6182319.1 hypothetical protein [Leeia speluncae]
MSQQARDLLCLSFIAPSAVAQYRGVDFAGAQIAAAGARVAGISKRPAAAGEAYEAAAYGTAVCETGGVFAAGVPLVMDATGRVVAAATLSVASGATAVTSTAANGAILTGGVPPQFVVGDSLQASTAAGQFVEVLLSR